MLIRQAPAKINLFLHIVGRFDDGYHDLQTAYQLLDWCDELEFEPTQDGQIRRGIPIAGVAESEDITIRAARRLRERFAGERGAIIRCRKRLPIGAGLGGGSSDAAATLLALNELWGLGATRAQLARIGAEIGADVPVFVHGKNAWAEGRGDALSDISIPEQLYVVIYPDCSISTARVYREFKGTPFRARITPAEFHRCGLGNDLEAAACRLYPEVRALIERLKSWGEPRMTGSGSAVFMPVESRDAGESILSALPSAWMKRVCVGQAS